MLLEKLVQAVGVSGYEKVVRDMIKEEVKGYADEITTDAIGNLIVFKKGTGPHKKKIMAAAHMDEIGFQVIKIDEKGQIRVKPLGYHWIHIAYLNRVQFSNGVVGILSSVTDIQNIKDNDCTKLYVDIGAMTKAEAEKSVKVGDVACYIGDYVALKDNNIMAKGIDDRIGCYIMIEALKRIETCENDLYFVFTVQEELGCRGSIVTAERIQPDLGIAIDITPAHDYPCDLDGANAIGAGTAIKISDPSVICDPYLIEEMIKCCEEHQIPYQRDVIYKGGTDAGSINMAHYGIKAAGISVVTRFPHSPSAIANLGDMNASIDLLTHFVQRKFDLDQE